MKKNDQLNTSKRRLRRRLLALFLMLLLACIGKAAWIRRDFILAVKEAKTAGFEWEANDLLKEVKENWRNLFRRGAWTNSYRELGVRGVCCISDYTNLIHRLNPTKIVIEHCGIQDLNFLMGLAELQVVEIGQCQLIKSLEGLAGIQSIYSIKCVACPTLENINEIKSLAKLQNLEIISCPQLRELDCIADLPELLTVAFNECTGIKDIHALKKHTNLLSLSLFGSTSISKDNLNELNKWIPYTDIIMPDGGRVDGQN